MIDFHTHTFFSDGALCPAEHIRRAEDKGYRVLGIADHGDLASMKMLLGVALAAARAENPLGRIQVVAGLELTHVRPAHLVEAVNRARQLGAQLVIAHGETITEPVEPGTNRAAIAAEVDILAHPGLIAEEDAALAAEKGVLLEVTAKPGHALSNGHVVAMARATGAKLILGSDGHAPEQFLSAEHARKVLLGAGLTEGEIAAMQANAEALAATVQTRGE
jgi:histidinol phosphatase-like PHP family hydrolase